MYNYIRSIALSRSIGSQWEEVNLGDKVVYDIFNQYSKVYLVLTNPVLPNEVYVDLGVLRSEYSSYQKTLKELLIALGNRSLPTVTALPSTSVKVAKYSDAFRAEYKVALTKIGIQAPSNYPVTDLDDLVVTRPAYPTDLTLLHDYCLVSVNGYYHMTDTDGTKAYVYKGGDTLRKSNNNQLGILSFLNVGKLSKIKLSKDRIYAHPNSTLKDNVYFDIDEDLTNKSCFLVLGGYLVFPDEGVLWQTDDQSFALDLNKLPYLERMLESQYYIDMSELQLTTSDINLDILNTAELWSNDVIKRYLTMSQSYLVVVDIPNLVTNKIYLRHSSLPGMFTAYSDPTYPLIVGHGKVAEYWKTREDDHWSVTVVDSFYRNFVVSQQPAKPNLNITSALTPVSSFYHGRGFLLEISGYRN